MAPVVAAPPTPVPNHNPNKIKRPPPAGIQTNGAAAPVRSSPSQSPSMPAKRPPPNAGPNGKQQAAQQTSAGTNPVPVNGVNGLTSRPSNISRSRRDTLTKKPGLRSSSQALDNAVSQTFPPRPEVITDGYILKKFAGNPPSLVVHLHPTHFRFDQQDGIFPYKSPMRIFLEHIRTRTVPHDLLTYFNDNGVQFYDGCLIVQVHNHKSTAQAKETNTRPTSASSKTAPFSIHNYNPYITPSPYVPYPKEEVNGSDTAPAPSAEQKTGAAEGNEKESMPAPALPEGQKNKGPPTAKVITVVLHPTQSSLQHDLLLKALTPSEPSEGNGVIPPPTPGMPPTPTAVVPKPPASKKRKRESMELDISNLAAVEGQILLATAGPLHLEPTKTVDELIEKLESRAGPQHSEPPPQPKKRKRTVAERAADEAQAAEHQKYMLTMDERLSSTNGGGQGGGEGADGNGQSGGAVFEPRFERFKVIADIKREHAEKKEREKIHQAEQERRLAEQRKQQEAARLAENAEKARQEQEAARRARIQEQQRRAHLQQQAQQQQAAAAQAAQAQAAQAQAAAAQAAAAQSAQSPPNMQPQLSQASHGHPTPSPMPTAVPAHRFPQGVSQPPVSSPVVRQNTPQNMSSPMVGNVPMQQSNSGMGGSPARPSSVVQNQPPMGAPMAVSMSARGSQQSHPGGTPRMPSATPQLGHNTPINRPMPTPRLTQASPPPPMMAQNSQPGQPMLMGGQSLQQQMQSLQNMHNMQNMQNMQNPMLAAQIAAQQRQRIAMQNQMGANMQQNGMLNGQNAQQIQQLQQFHQRQQQAQQLQQQLQQQLAAMQNQSQPMLNPAMQAQLTQRYQQQIAQLQQQSQQVQNGMGNQQMGNMNFMNANGMNGGHMAMQQMQQQNPQQQQMMQQQQQQQQQPQHQLPPIVQQRQFQLYQSQIQQLAARFGGNTANIPVEVMNNFKRECSIKARQWYNEQLAIRRTQQQQQQQQQLMMQSQQGMPNGMMQGM